MKEFKRKFFHKIGQFLGFFFSPFAILMIFCMRIFFLDQLSVNQISEIYDTANRHWEFVLFYRSAILTYIEEEDRQRKWYISQLDNVRQRLEKVTLTDGVGTQWSGAKDLEIGAGGGCL